MNSSKELKNPLSSESSDKELFSAMCKKEEIGLFALEIFYNRYVDALYKTIYWVKGLLEADREDLVHETLLQAYRAAESFKATEDSDTERNRRHTLAWLGRIAANIQYQKFRRQQGTSFETLEAETNDSTSGILLTDKISVSERGLKIKEVEEEFLKVFDKSNHSISKQREILLDVLENLPERERDILLSTYEELDMQNPKKQLSREKIKELKERYNISSDNLKQIRHRIKRFVFNECLRRIDLGQ